MYLSLGYGFPSLCVWKTPFCKPGHIYGLHRSVLQANTYHVYPTPQLTNKLLSVYLGKTRI